MGTTQGIRTNPRRRTDTVAWRRLLLATASCAALSLSQPTAAGAQAAADRVLLAEVMPSLNGTPLGAVEVAPAPSAGASITIRRADVLRALTQAGMQENLKSSEIPPSVKVTREAVAVSRDELSVQAHEAVRSATAPCELRDVRYPSEVRVQAGPRQFRAEFTGLHSGSMNGSLFIESGGRETRVPVIASLNCPAPEVQAGAQLIAIAQVGAVRATAPAEARQPGRVGEVIRVTNRATGASLRARIIDSRTVEVLP